MRKLIASVALVTAVAVGGLAVAGRESPPTRFCQILELARPPLIRPPPRLHPPRPVVTRRQVARQGARRPGREGHDHQEQAAAVKQAVKTTAKDYLAKHPGVRKACARVRCARLSAEVSS